MGKGHRSWRPRFTSITMRPTLASVNIHPPARATSAFPNAPPSTGPAIRTGPIAVISVTGVPLAGFFMPLTSNGLRTREGGALWIDWR